MADFHPGYLLNAFLFAVLGILMLIGSFALLDKMTPYALWKEIVEEKNTALAILVGLMSVGVSLIIAAAVH